MNSSQKIAVVVLLALGLLGAVWSARNRMVVERANRTVALCVDDLEVRQLAALTGAQPEQLLARLKSAGATHLAISERTLGDLLQSGAVRLYDGQPAGGLIGPASVMVPLSRRLTAAGFAYDGLQIQVGREVLLPVPPVVAGMLKLGVLYDPLAVKTARAAGLQIVARPTPDFLLTPPAVLASLQAARATGSHGVLFNGVAVAGGAQLARQTAEMLAATDLKFAYVELVPQEGATNLASALKYQIVRTHSISQEEMLKTSAARGLDRFTLAVTERNIRLCYMRLLLNPQLDIVQANEEYVRSISSALNKAGYAFGDPVPFAPVSVPRAALILIALGVVGGALWAMVELLRPRACWFWGLGAVGLVGVLGGSVVARGLVESLFPLLSAIVFPTLAVLVISSWARRLGAASAGNPQTLRALGLALAAVALTALGGLFIAGMLSSSAYMMQIAQFKGVKLAQLLPLVLVLGGVLGRTFTSTDEPGWPGLRSGLTNVAEAVVKYWHAIAVFVVLGLVAFMIMRSGNESAVEVSGLEMKLRALLDQVLVVRPRTKEILFGFPALLLGLWLLLQARPRTAWLWLTFGVIGLLSTTNTFCHLHTPLPVSLLRVANGIWVGLLVGLLWLVAKALLERICRAIWWTDKT